MGEIDHVAEFQLGVTTNAIAMFVLAIITIYSLRIISIKNRKNRSFYLLFGVSFIEICTHVITTIFQYYNFFGNNTLGVIMYSFVFTVNCIFFISWMIYLIQKLKNKRILKGNFTKNVVVLSLPIILLLILSIVNMFTPIFFSFTDFEYERKTLYDLNAVVPVCYLLYTLWLFIKSDNKKRVYLEIPFIELLIPVIVAHILEEMFLGLCVIPLGNVITLIILVFNNMQQNLSVDKLTSLYTRKELFDHLEGLIEQKKKRKRIMGIMLDLNDFKSINDTHGHLVGDAALMDFGYIVRNSLPHNASGFRYAGDEFIVIVKASDEEETNNIAMKISDNLAKANEKGNKKYNLSAAYGITTLGENELITDFIERMDQKMYENKMERKKKIRQ